MNVVFRRLILAGIVLTLAAGPAQPTSAETAPPRVSSSGTQLPGSQLYSDAGLDLLDWNGDGKLDLFLSDPSMIPGSVYLNQGTLSQPKFGFNFWYPLNLTEAECRP